MATLILTIECESEDDVNDVTFLLFGPIEAADRFGQEVETFGDFVVQHSFTLTRVGEATPTRRVGRPRKAYTAPEEY